MGNRWARFLLGILIFVGCSLLVSAQMKQSDTTAKASDSGSTPDLSGVWMRDAPPATALQYWIYELNQEEPPMTPWGTAKFKGAKSSFGAHQYGLEETNDQVLTK